MKFCRTQSRNGGDLRRITNFGHEYLRVAIAKNRKARRRIARVDCISELNLDSGKAEVGSQRFRLQER